LSLRTLWAFCVACLSLVVAGPAEAQDLDADGAAVDVTVEGRGRATKVFELTDGSSVVGEVLDEGDTGYVVRKADGEVVRIKYQDLVQVRVVSVAGTDSSAPIEKTPGAAEEGSERQPPPYQLLKWAPAFSIEGSSFDFLFDHLVGDESTQLAVASGARAGDSAAVEGGEFLVFDMANNDPKRIWREGGPFSAMWPEVALYPFNLASLKLPNGVVLVGEQANNAPALVYQWNGVTFGLLGQFDTHSARIAQGMRIGPESDIPALMSFLPARGLIGCYYNKDSVWEGSSTACPGFVGVRDSLIAMKIGRTLPIETPQLIGARADGSIAVYGSDGSRLVESPSLGAPIADIGLCDADSDGLQEIFVATMTGGSFGSTCQLHLLDWHDRRLNSVHQWDLGPCDDTAGPRRHPDGRLFVGLWRKSRTEFVTLVDQAGASYLCSETSTAQTSGILPTQ
jgi:hypothetical protein